MFSMEKNAATPARGNGENIDKSAVYCGNVFRDKDRGGLTLKMYKPLCGDLPANPCREVVAKRTCFTVKRQSQA
jgi:hypothetical protein